MLAGWQVAGLVAFEKYVSSPEDSLQTHTQPKSDDERGEREGDGSSTGEGERG